MKKFIKRVVAYLILVALISGLSRNTHFASTASTAATKTTTVYLYPTGSSLANKFAKLEFNTEDEIIKISGTSYTKKAIAKSIDQEYNCDVKTEFYQDNWKKITLKKFVNIYNKLNTKNHAYIIAKIKGNHMDSLFMSSFKVTKALPKKDGWFTAFNKYGFDDEEALCCMPNGISKISYSKNRLKVKGTMMLGKNQTKIIFNVNKSFKLAKNCVLADYGFDNDWKGSKAKFFKRCLKRDHTIGFRMKKGKIVEVW